LTPRIGFTGEGVPVEVEFEGTANPSGIARGDNPNAKTAMEWNN
jgi:hypothetical protein